MKIIALLLAVLAASPDVELTTVEDETLSGTLTKITAEEITLQAADGPRAVKVSSVLSVRAAEPEAASDEAGSEEKAASTTVQFQGGGSLSCDNVVIRDRKVLAQPALGAPIKVPLDVVAALRFRPLDPAVADDWKEVVASAPARDLLVVRNGEALDRVEGTISALDEKTFTFLVGDQRVAIDRTKPRLFGIVAAHANNPTEKTSICDVRLRNGDWLAASELAFDGNTLRVAAAGGWETKLPWESIEELDFGRGRIRYLSDLQPRDMVHTPFLETELDKVFDIRLDRSDASPDTPIRIENHAYRKGLVIHSRTELVYWLGGEYQRFVTVAGIEDLVRPHGSVELTIALDGKEVLNKTVTGTDAPIPIDLDVSGARELSILVDFAKDWDTGDHLALGEARLIK